MTVFRNTRLLLAGAVVALTGAGLAIALPATAAPRAATPPKVTAHSDYLALGDSVSFGYRESDSVPTPDYSTASSLVGYPALIGAQLGLHVTNASCPGETSASLNDAKAQSNGCETGAEGGPGYRSAYPLHVKYSGSQLAFAEKFLKTHPNTKLVTLMIGANDGFLCQETTADHCTSVSEQVKLVKKIEKNVSTTLKAVRGTGYKGQIVVLNYYSTDYTNKQLNKASAGVNLALDTGAENYDVQVANGYRAFRNASKFAGLSTCNAGLLTQVEGGGCSDHVHPSLAGQYVLAGSVEKAIKK